jgi:hypothetical protein
MAQRSAEMEYEEQIIPAELTAPTSVGTDTSP